jgi:hypothetical protein
MKIIVNDSEKGPLTHDQWKEARKLLLAHPASGRVMNLDEACEAQRARVWPVAAALLVGSWIMALIFALAGNGDGGIAMFAAGIFVPLVTYLCVCLSVAFGRPRFAERYRGHPEPGVLVKADEAGLRIGERSAAWPDIALAAMRFRTDVDGEYVLQRLQLARGFEGEALDLELIEQGRAVVGYAFLQLCPQPPERARRR